MTEEMVEIMDKLSDYVPEVKDSKSGESNDYPLPFFGDMLTAARARTAQETRVTSKGKKALRGLFPIAADWHAKVNYMEVCKHKYTPKKSCMHAYMYSCVLGELYSHLRSSTWRVLCLHACTILCK